MTSFTDLGALNKSSGKVATFAVRVVGAKVTMYTFTSKRNNSQVTAEKFEAWLIGLSPQAYCIGYVKGPPAAIAEAKKKYVEDSVWILAQAVFDIMTNISFISTPVPWRVDLAKSKMTSCNSEGQENQDLCDRMPQEPVPPRSVAEIARITHKRATDLLAIVKSISEQRNTKSGIPVADVELIDNSETTPGALATVKVSVFGGDKLSLLERNVGEPMVFFNLSVTCSGGQMSVAHYADELCRDAPTCEKQEALSAAKSVLTEATNTTMLTTEWAPTQAARDVSGPTPLSCAAFLDFTAEMPDAGIPELVQVMWAHLEEPEPDTDVLHQSGERIWYRIQARDATGSVTVGVPQKTALQLAQCASKDQFLEKHKHGELNMPLLCHARIGRSTRSASGGASQLTRYVNHTLLDMQAVQWEATSAPNAAYNGVLSILNNCPPHEEGITFVFLNDLQPDPYYGFCVSYDGLPGPVCTYVATLLSSEQKSVTEAVGDGFKVITADIKDCANPTPSTAEHKTVGYCSLANLSGFRLDPPRGKATRCALAFISKMDCEGLHIHKLEYIEPDQIENAVLCMQKLRMLCKQIRPTADGKRSHAVPMEDSWAATTHIKKARVLESCPTAGSLTDLLR